MIAPKKKREDRQAEIIAVDFSRRETPFTPSQARQRLRYQVARTLTMWGLTLAGCGLAVGLFLTLIYAYLT